MPVETQASVLLDQSCCASANFTGFFTLTNTRVQTFTVGLGGQLTAIDLGLALTSGSLPAFELYATAFTVGQDVASFGSPLTTLALVNSGVPVPGTAPGVTPTFFSADLSSAGLFVAPGQQLSIVQRPSATNLNGAWVGTTGNQYGGGTALTTSGGSTTLVPQGFGDDLSFRTFVDSPTAVPEAPAFFLVGVGLVGLVAGRKVVLRSDK
jgi:hypothetical protein